MRDVLLMTEQRAFPSVPIPLVASTLERSRVEGRPVPMPGTLFAVDVVDFREVHGALVPDGSVRFQSVPRKCYRVVVRRCGIPTPVPVELFVDENAAPLWGWERGEEIRGR